MTSNLEAVIGLEIHVQLSTETKLFCNCRNDDFSAAPNTLICPICTGQPGALPRPSSAAINAASLAALTLGATIQPTMLFDRKQYFYPDLPMGYQISQYEHPLALGGTVELSEFPSVPLTRVHVENDAGKLTHVGKKSLVDFNRAGSPLIEIVTEPDIRSAAQAKALAEMVQLLVQYCGASTADLFRGQMRFDASVSLRPTGDTTLHPRTEIKNLNSFRSLELAINYEIQRQTTLWEKDAAPTTQTTVGFDDDTGCTFTMREKESAADYRYFPEPDIPPISFTESDIAAYKEKVPTLPLARKAAIIAMGIDEEKAKKLISAKPLADYFEEVARLCKNPVRASSWILTELLGRCSAKGDAFSPEKIPARHLADLISRIDTKDISGKMAKDIFEEMYNTGATPENIIAKKGLSQISDDSAILPLVQAVISENETVVQQIKNGKEAAIGFLVGQLMKKSGGQVNPAKANELLKSVIFS